MKYYPSNTKTPFYFQQRGFGNQSIASSYEVAWLMIIKLILRFLFRSREKIRPL